MLGDKNAPSEVFVPERIRICLKMLTVALFLFFEFIEIF